MKKSNKKALYESIIFSVAKEVKKALNEYSKVNANITEFSVQDQKLDDNDELFVDLGLPSGTLWCKYNLGVNPKHLNNYENWYGNFYAWGETKPKDDYSWRTYRFGSPEYIRKYNNRDNVTKILYEDDAAYITLKNSKIPSEEHFKELISYTTKKFVIDYKGIPKLNGIIFFGMNKQELFIPAAGSFYNSNNVGINEYGSLWTSDIDYIHNMNAYVFRFNNSLNMCKISYEPRFLGLCIRPILLN